MPRRPIAPRPDAPRHPGTDTATAPATVTATALALVAVAVVLGATADDRHVGKFSDGRQMIRTAVAIVETGGIGMASGAARALARPAGDSVSRYGMGTSLAQLPAAILAPAVERRRGAGSSNALFLLAPFVAVLLSCAAAGGVARRIAGERAAPVAILLSGLGSPLGAYASSDFSEPLQAAVLAGIALFSLSAARRSEGEEEGSAIRAAALAGTAAGAAVLLKSSLLLPAPLLLLPLLAAGGRRGRLALGSAAAAAAGASIPVATWLAFEIARFGRPFGGYGGEGFTHPILDGAWRLLVGPNRGLVLFFPPLVFAVWGLARAARRGGPSRLAAAGAASAFVVLLATSAAWWAWHGAGGWGPRFLVPAVPLLAPFAAAALAETGPVLRRGVVAAAVLLNVPPLLLSPALADVFVANCRPGAPPAGVLEALPAASLEREPDGRIVTTADNILPYFPAASPHLQLAWQWAASLASSPPAAARRLDSPPWRRTRPDLVPRLSPLPAELVAVLAPPPRWSFLGRSLLGERDDPALLAVWPEALADQVLRAQETGRGELALRLAERLSEASPGPAADALLLESLRLLGRPETLQSVYSSLPPSRKSSPEVFVVLALAARDRGEEETARRALAAAAPYFPGTPLSRVAGEPSRAWPRTYREMTLVPERAAEK